MPHDSSVVVAFARFNAGKSPDTTRTALKSLEEVLAKDPTKLSAYVVASMLYSELVCIVSCACEACLSRLLRYSHVRCRRWTRKRAKC